MDICKKSYLFDDDDDDDDFSIYLGIMVEVCIVLTMGMFTGQFVLLCFFWLQGNYLRYMDWWTEIVSVYRAR